MTDAEYAAQDINQSIKQMAKPATNEPEPAKSDAGEDFSKLSYADVAKMINASESESDALAIAPQFKHLPEKQRVELHEIIQKRITDLSHI